MQQRGETDFTLFHLSVAVPGLEPRLREPESRVLPLHHTAEKTVCCPTETRTQSNRTKIWCATITPWGNVLINILNNYFIAVVIGFEPIIYPRPWAILRVNDNFFIHYKQIIIKSITV